MLERLKTKLVLAVAVAAAAVWWPNAAGAIIIRCYDATLLERTLDKAYREFPAAQGVTKNQEVLRIYSTAERDKWTAVLVSANGVACILSSGDSWETLEPTDASSPDAPVGTE